MDALIALLLALSSIMNTSAAVELAACPTQWQAVRTVTTVFEDDSMTHRLVLVCPVRHDER